MELTSDQTVPLYVGYIIRAYLLGTREVFETRGQIPPLSSWMGWRVARKQISIWAKGWLTCTVCIRSQKRGETRSPASTESSGARSHAPMATVESYEQSFARIYHPKQWVLLSEWYVFFISLANKSDLCSFFRWCTLQEYRMYLDIHMHVPVLSVLNESSLPRGDMVQRSISKLRMLSLAEILPQAPPTRFNELARWILLAHVCIVLEVWEKKTFGREKGGLLTIEALKTSATRTALRCSFADSPCFMFEVS